MLHYMNDHDRFLQSGLSRRMLFKCSMAGLAGLALDSQILQTLSAQETAPPLPPSGVYVRRNFTLESASKPPAALQGPKQALRSLFVSPNGNDSWAGTQSQPWRTLSVAFDRIRSRDELILMGDEFVVPTPLMIEKITDITIKAYPGQRPIIRFTGPHEYSFQIGQGVRYMAIEGLGLVRATNAPGSVVGIGGTYITVRGCLVRFADGFSPSEYDGIKILSDHILIESCEFLGVPNQCIDAVGHTDITIRNNKMHHSTTGVVVKGGCRDIWIENNLCYNLKHTGIGLGGSTDPIWHNHSNTEAEVENAVVTKNILYYDQPNSIGGGISLMGAKNCIIYRNTLYGAGLHVRAGGDPRRMDHFSSDNELVNNIIFRTGNDGILVVDVGNSRNLKLRNNLYWKTTGSGEFKINGTWYTFQDYVADFSFDTDSMFSDPKFVDELGHDFRLRPDSPGIRMGGDIGAIERSESAR